MRGGRDRLTDGYVEREQGPRRGKLAVVLTVICFVAAAALGAQLVASAASSHDEPADNPATTTPSNAPSPPPPSTPPASVVPSGTDHHGTAGKPPASVTTVAARFIDAWLLRKPPAVRLAALRQVASEFLASSLSTTDLNALPPTTRYGEPKLKTWTALSAQYRVWLRTGETVDVTLTPDGTAWSVVALEPGPKGTPPNPTGTKSR